MRNEEVRISIEDLLQLVRGYPRENTGVELQEEDLRLFKRHYSKLMYQAILTCTQKSLQARGRAGLVTATQPPRAAPCRAGALRLSHTLTGDAQ